MVSISLVIPHTGDPFRLAGLVRSVSRIGGVSEIIVVLSSTAPARIPGRRVRVLYQSILRYPGRGIAMRDGYYFSEGDVVVYIDSNVDKPDPRDIVELYRPILDGYADVVKSGISRRFQQIEDRVRSLLTKLYPGLGGIEHPLSPYTAAKRKALSTVEWEPGWGADIAMLIDTHVNGFRVSEIQTGLREKPRRVYQLYRESVEEIVDTIVKRGIRDNRIKNGEADNIVREILRGIGGEA